MSIIRFEFEAANEPWPERAGGALTSLPPYYIIIAWIRLRVKLMYNLPHGPATHQANSLQGRHVPRGCRRELRLLEQRRFQIGCYAKGSDH